MSKTLAVESARRDHGAESPQLESLPRNRIAFHILELDLDPG
jgi:hypothetical protein